MDEHIVHVYINGHKDFLNLRKLKNIDAADGRSWR